MNKFDEYTRVKDGLPKENMVCDIVGVRPDGIFKEMNMVVKSYESKSTVDMLKELEKTVYITHNSDKRYGCMTTLDLIEKYGIGHNCLSDAYALGMAHGLDDKEDAIELAEKKARVDAIEDCIGIVSGCLIDFPVTHDKTINALCQLKEKEND